MLVQTAAALPPPLVAGLIAALQRLQPMILLSLLHALPISLHTAAVQACTEAEGALCLADAYDFSVPEVSDLIGMAVAACPVDAPLRGLEFDSSIGSCKSAPEGLASSLYGLRSSLQTLQVRRVSLPVEAVE